MEIRIQTIGAIEIIRIRHVGPYSEIGKCFERLFAWAAQIGIEPGRVISLSHGDPATVAPEHLRSDACLEFHTDATPPPGIFSGRLQGGRYAVLTHHGPYEAIPGAYRHLFTAWLPQSGEDPDGRPCMEIYRNSPVDTPPSGLITDLCLPLRTDDPA